MKIKHSKFFVIIFSLLLSVCAIGSVITLGVSAAANGFTVKAFNEYYKLNEVLDIPKATFNVNGQTVTAVSTVSYPSGKYLNKTQIVLDESGKYTVEYKAVVNGTLYSEKKDFTVKNALFSTELGSTAYFGSHEYTPNIKGIVLSLKNYDVFHFNKIIDLSKLTKDDTLFNMYFTPEIIGQNDVNQIDFTFTDIYNPDNYVTYTTKIYNAEDGNYSVVYANGQLPAAVQKNPSYNGQRPTMLIDGVKHVVHINNEYGTWSKINFIGVSTDGLDIGQERLDVRFDYASRRFYTDHLSCPEKFGKAEIIVTDLDDSRLYTNPWGGFTTGEVYMTVSAKKYNAQACNIVITAIAGENLNVDGIVDTTAPEITVNYGELSQGVAPKGKLNKPYRVFDCSVFDDYTKEPTLDAKVYYNYYTTNKIMVEVSDGAFIPRYSGVYTIEYTSSDLFGNKKVKRVDVQVSDAAESLTFALGGGATAGNAGEAIQVKEYTASSTVSDYAVSIKAVNNDKAGVAYDVNPVTRSFTPMYAGKYTVTYVCEDYISSVSRTYSLQISPSNKTLIAGEATSLPKYFIKGCTYTLPVLETNTFATGEPVKGVAKIYAKAGASGTFGELTDGKYTVPQTDKVYIKYSTANDLKQYVVPVVDVGYNTESSFDKSKYFYGTGFTRQSDKNAIMYTSTGSLASMEYVNALLSDGFSMAFSVSALSGSFTGLDIYMTDSYDPAKTVRFHYFVENGTTYFKINDSAIYFDLAGKMGDGNSTFDFVYDEKTQTVSPYNEKEILIQEYVGGEKFAGFSDRVYLKVEMTGGSGTVFNLKTLNKQVMNNDNTDMLGPKINLVKIEGYKVLNEVITVSPAFASDVLDPAVRFYLKVLDPSKKAVTDENGESLSESYNTAVAHKIKLTAYGRWTVSFYAIDSVGNETESKFYVTVTDIQAPVITVNPTQTECAVNGDITVATPVITDNIDTNLDYSVLIYKPNSDIAVCEGKTFKAEEKGTYVIYYYCADSYGNVGIAKYTVSVK